MINGPCDLCTDFKGLWIDGPITTFLKSNPSFFQAFKLNNMMHVYSLYSISLFHFFITDKSDVIVLLTTKIMLIECILQQEHN